MIQTACTIVTRHEGRNISGCNGVVAVHQRSVGVEVIIGCTTYPCLFRLGHLLVATVRLVGVVTRRSRILLGIILEVGGRLVEVVAVSLDHTAVLARERAATLGVGALLRSQNGLLGLQEVVVLDEHAGTRCSTHAVFRHIVEVVVPHVYTHGTDTRMARVRVVKPVVVVRDVVRTTLRLHTEHVRLAGIPETVVRNGDIFRVALHVGGSVALGVVAAAVLAIELVGMVNPDVRIVGIERDAIVHATHDAEVAELYALGVAY